MHCKLGTGGLLFLNGTSFQTRMQMQQMLRCEGHSIQMCCTSQHKLDSLDSNHPTRLRVWASRLWQLIIVLHVETIALLENSVNTATAIKWNSNIYSRAQNLQQSWCEANMPNLNRQQSTAAIIRLARQEKSTSFRSTLHVYRFLQLPLCKAVKKRTSDGLPAVCSVLFLLSISFQISSIFCVWPFNHPFT